MNELEKALEQLNIKYETNGKQYKIPTTRENLVELLKGYIAMTINLQSKIDKANEIIKDWHQEYNGLMETNNIYIPKDKPSLFDLRDILKEDE